MKCYKVQDVLNLLFMYHLLTHWRIFFEKKYVCITKRFGLYMICIRLNNFYVMKIKNTNVLPMIGFFRVLMK